jgi:hypothetical protein
MTISEYNDFVESEMSEYQIQCKVIIHLKSVYPDALFTASAGGMRTNIRTAVKMKAMGYSKGTPDLWVLEKRKGYSGLVIELKKHKGGQLSPEQKDWLEKLNQRGYKAICCKGYSEAVKTIDDYFGK